MRLTASIFFYSEPIILLYSCPAVMIYKTLSPSSRPLSTNPARYGLSQPYYLRITTASGIKNPLRTTLLPWFRLHVRKLHRFFCNIKKDGPREQTRMLALSMEPYISTVSSSPRRSSPSTVKSRNELARYR